MPIVPYHNRRHRAYRALLITVVRTDSIPPCNRDEDCAEYGVMAKDVEKHLPQFDWRQVKYLLDCLVKEGRAVKTIGRRGIRVKFWPRGGLKLLKKQEQMRHASKKA